MLAGVRRRSTNSPARFTSTEPASSAAQPPTVAPSHRTWRYGSSSRGERAHFETVGTLEQILLGPSTVPDGTMNLAGGLRKAMATTGYTDVKEFQRVEIVVG